LEYEKWFFLTRQTVGEVKNDSFWRNQLFMMEKRTISSAAICLGEKKESLLSCQAVWDEKKESKPEL
jgi:hypothetical protein